MKTIEKNVYLVNLIAILVYSLVIRIATRGESTGIAILSAIAVIIQVFLCLVIAVVRYRQDNNPGGRKWVLSAGMVLLVGFSTCLGNAQL